MQLLLDHITTLTNRMERIEITQATQDSMKRRIVRLEEILRAVKNDVETRDVKTKIDVEARDMKTKFDNLTT